MSRVFGTGLTPVYRRVMIFIDGGYLREGFKRIYKHERINFPGLFVLLKNLALEGNRLPELIRAYYYDAIVAPEEDLEEYKKQKEYYSEIEKYGVCDVKLTRLKKTEIIEILFTSRWSSGLIEYRRSFGCRQEIHCC